MSRKIGLKALVVTSLFVALAVVLRFFSIMVPIGGAGAMRVSLDGIPMKMPSIIFGPFIGGISGAMTDLLAYIVKPMGGYIPLLTVTSVLGCIFTGFIWNKIGDISVHKVEKLYFIFSISLGGIGFISHIFLKVFTNTYIYQLLSMLGKKALFVAVALETISILSLIILSINKILKNKNFKGHIYDNYIKMLLSVGIPSLIVTTLNTYILIMFIPALAGKGFMIFWIPRITEAFMMIVIQSYMMSSILCLYKEFQYRFNN